MAEGDKLAAAAKEGCPGVENCHQTVVGWFAKAQLISQPDFEKLRGKYKTATDMANAALVKSTDQVCNRSNMKDLAPGTVVGFFNRDVYQHSMVYLGGNLIAGVNNLQVLNLDVATKVGTKYCAATVDQLKWSAAGTTVGPDYSLRAASASEVLKRIKGAL